MRTAEELFQVAGEQKRIYDRNFGAPLTCRVKPACHRGGHTLRGILDWNLAAVQYACRGPPQSRSEFDPRANERHPGPRPGPSSASMKSGSERSHVTKRPNRISSRHSSELDEAIGEDATASPWICLCGPGETSQWLMDLPCKVRPPMWPSAQHRRPCRRSPISVRLHSNATAQRLGLGAVTPAKLCRCNFRPPSVISWSSLTWWWIAKLV